MTEDQIKFHAQWWERRAAGESIEDLNKKVQLLRTDSTWGKRGRYTQEISTCYAYRWKPEIVTLEIPNTMKEEPKAGEFYWFRAAKIREGYDCRYWAGSPIDFRLFRHGIWATEEEMKEVIEADLSLHTAPNNCKREN